MNNFRNRLFLTKDEINAQPWTVESTDLIKTLYVPKLFFVNGAGGQYCFYGNIYFNTVNSSGSNASGSYTTAAGQGNSVYVGSFSQFQLNFGYISSGSGYDYAEMFRGIYVGGNTYGIFSCDNNSLISHGFEDLYIRINAQELFGVPYIRYKSTSTYGNGPVSILNGHIYYEPA